MSINIAGLDELDASVKKIDQLAQAFGDEFVKRVKQKTPVDTGRLQNSWELEVEDTEITVTNQAVNDRGEPYAVYVEFGTEHTPGVFMLNSTMQESEQILKKAMSKVGLD